MTTMRPFSRRGAPVSGPLPLRSRYATRSSPSTRSVPIGPFGETFTRPSAASGAVPTKNIGCAAIHAAIRSSIASNVRATALRDLAGGVELARHARERPVEQFGDLRVGRERERALAGLDAVADAIRARERVRVARPRVRVLRADHGRLLAGRDLAAEVARQGVGEREVEQPLDARHDRPPADERLDRPGPVAEAQPQ